MADKRFWSGAIIVMTVAVAGAGAVPSLLLRPTAEPIPFENTFTVAAAVSTAAAPKSTQPIATAAKPAEPKAAELATPREPPRIAAPVAIASTPVAPNAAGLTEPRTEPKAVPAPPSVAAAPAAIVPVAVAAAPVVAPQTQRLATDLLRPANEAPRAAQPDAFPPVQPIEVAARHETTPSDKLRAARSRAAARKWIRIARGRSARVARRGGGSIRPAAYPIREFLAWRH